jgi:dTDP-4-dehydrorhamnose reductase
MIILVFGGNGQLGKELGNDRDVFLVPRKEADFRVSGDCKKAILKVKPDLVINAAAYTAVDSAENNEAQAMRVNAEAVSEIAETCAFIEAPLVHISTDYVFDGSGDSAWRPNDPTAPLQIYGHSKLKGEEAVIKSNAIYAIIRTSAVFSANDRNFVTTMERLSRDRKELSVVSDQVSNPTPASELAHAALQVGRQLCHDKEKSGIYHYAGMPFINWSGFAREIFQILNRDVQVNDIETSSYPTPALRPMNSRLDCTSIMTTFGLTQPDWRHGLKEVLEEYLSTAANKNNDALKMEGVDNTSLDKNAGHIDRKEALFVFDPESFINISKNKSLAYDLCASSIWVLEKVIRDFFIETRTNHLPSEFDSYYHILGNLNVIKKLCEPTSTASEETTELLDEVIKLKEHIEDLENQLAILKENSPLNVFSKSYVETLGKTLASPWAFGALALLVSNFFGIGLNDLTLTRLNEAYDNLRITKPLE